MENYIVTGISKNGSRFYYNGKAGAGWLTTDKAEAFPYSKEGARRKSLNFNRMTEIHGIRFNALPLVPDLFDPTML